MNDPLHKGLNASDTVSEIFHSMRETIKEAREPADNWVEDYPALMGALIDLGQYLDMAERQNSAMRSSNVELFALIKRIQGRFHTVYKAYQNAQAEAKTAFRDGEANMFRLIISDVDEETMDFIYDAAKTLSSMSDEQRAIAHEKIRLALFG